MRFTHYLQETSVFVKAVTFSILPLGQIQPLQSSDNFGSRKQTFPPFFPLFGITKRHKVSLPFSSSPYVNPREPTQTSTNFKFKDDLQLSVLSVHEHTVPRRRDSAGKPVNPKVGGVFVASKTTRRKAIMKIGVFDTKLLKKEVET